MRRLPLILLLGISVLLFFGAVAPATAPVTLTSPDSGSMEPTAPEHSLVVVTGGTPAVDDIALYETPTQATPVLHRVVDVGEAGLITQGDANEATDQAAGNPPVEPGDVYGTVPTFAGQPLVIPYAGLVLTNPFILLGTWALLGLSLLYSTRSGSVVRETVVSVPLRKYAIAIGVVTMLLLPVAILAAPTVTPIEIVTSTTASPDAAQVAAPGETTTVEATFISPFLSVLHPSAHASGDLQVTGVESSFGGTDTTISVANEPSETEAIHEGQLTVYAYPAVLPESAVQALAAVHPALAAVVTGLLVGGPIVLLGLATDPRRVVRADLERIHEQRHSVEHSQLTVDPPGAGEGSQETGESKIVAEELWRN